MRFSHYRTQFYFLDRVHGLSLSPKKKRQQYNNQNDEDNQMELIRLNTEDNMNVDDVDFHEILRFSSMKSVSIKIINRYFSL